MEHYGTTFTGIRQVLIHYNIQGFAISQVVQLVRRIMRENNMHFPFTTTNPMIHGIMWRSINERRCPIESLMFSPAIRWLNSIPLGKTPKTYPYYEWVLTDNQGAPRLVTMDFMSDHGFHEKFRDIIGLPNSRRQRDPIIISAGSMFGMEPLYQKFIDMSLPVVDYSKMPVVMHTELKNGHLEHKQLSWTDLVYNDPEPLTPFDVADRLASYGAKDADRGITIIDMKPRQYGRHRAASRLAFLLSGMSLAQGNEQTLADRANEVVPRVYTANVTDPVEFRKAMQPFWKNIQSKGGKKNKKNWR
jgi:hypothetical protein